MKFQAVVVCLLWTLVPANAAGTKKAGFSVPAKYEGGTLPLNQHKIRATIAEDTIVIEQGGQRIAVPVGNITAISCGTDVRRRFGASLLGVVPVVHLDKAEKYYVGMTWSGESNGGSTSNAQAVFQLGSGEYRDFVAALERLTGRKAVDTAKVPTVVRYAL